MNMSRELSTVAREKDRERESSKEIEIYSSLSCVLCWRFIYLYFKLFFALPIWVKEIYEWNEYLFLTNKHSRAQQTYGQGILLSFKR